MRYLGRAVLLMGAAVALGGCVTPEAAYPVVGNPVNPRPADGYRVTCESSPSLTSLASGDVVAGCEAGWAAGGAAVKARG